MCGYKPADVEAAENLMQIHLAKLTKAREAGDWPAACSAIRALGAECDHASRIATTISLHSHLDHEPRFASLRRPS